MVLCGCRHPSILGLALVERRPHYFVPGVMGREGCLRHAFPKTPPPLKRKIGRKDEKNEAKACASGFSCLDALEANPSST